MKCKICGREWGVNSLPTVCHWCKTSAVVTDEQEQVVPFSERQLDLQLKHEMGSHVQLKLNLDEKPKE